MIEELMAIVPGQQVVYWAGPSLCHAAAALDDNDNYSHAHVIRQAAYDLFMDGRVILTQRRYEDALGNSTFQYIATGTKPVNYSFFKLEAKYFDDYCIGDD